MISHFIGSVVHTVLKIILVLREKDQLRAGTNYRRGPHSSSIEPLGTRSEIMEEHVNAGSRGSHV